MNFIDKSQIMQGIEPDSTADTLEKGINHKYYKREGTPGNYRYYYTEEEYKQSRDANTHYSGEVAAVFDSGGKQSIAKDREYTHEILDFLAENYQTADGNPYRPTFVDRQTDSYRIKLPEDVCKEIVEKFPGVRLVMAGNPKRPAIKIPFRKESSKESFYEITAGMVEYLDKHPVGSIKEHIENYAKDVRISFSEDEKQSLEEQYKSIKEKQKSTSGGHHR